MQYVESVKAFDAGNFAAFLEQFFKAIHSRYDIEKPVIQRFIRKAEHHQPTSRRKQRIEGYGATKQRLRKYAQEYYQMGNEYITMARDNRAALVNYDKALDLYPEYVDAWCKGIT